VKTNIKYEDFLEKFDTPLADKKTVAKEIASISFSKTGELVKLADLFPFYKGGNSIEIDILGGGADPKWKGARFWAKEIKSDSQSHLKQKNAEFRIGDLVYLQGDKNNIYRLKKIQAPWKHNITQYCLDHSDYSRKNSYGSPTQVRKNVVLCEKFGNVTKHFCDTRRDYSWTVFEIYQKFLFGNIELDHVLSFRAEKKKMTNVKTMCLFKPDRCSYNSGWTSSTTLSPIEKVDILDMCLKRDEYIRRADTMTSIIQSAAELAKNTCKE
jgi:hypothetical protein